MRTVYPGTRLSESLQTCLGAPLCLAQREVGRIAVRFLVDQDGTYLLEYADLIFGAVMAQEPFLGCDEDEAFAVGELRAQHFREQFRRRKVARSADSQ